ncbi:hypothetical protein HELRODRAFT_161346 [Helobdella robusta]|uniref:DNA polymerase n=1 Tax=Helobdella robusta TaxID=6412 RepID=T1ERD2_HELRO|nr:hypothetical protein HELRODRAFT_161346 [Helobdella robusta]ESO02110.1 hypothetical protein HELRODRAFT_161346 [Helobdella robusta]
MSENKENYVLYQEQMMKTYEQINEKWKALSYKKAIISLKKHPAKISTFEEAKSLSGVGEKLAEKIWEIVESGKLRKLDELSETEEVTSLNTFVNVWGAGPKTAQTWFAQGFRSLKDLEEKAQLTRCQKIGLKYYDELIERMERAEVQKIESVVLTEVNILRPGCELVVCGSYRRGQTTCGDVDILITHPDGSSHVGLFDALIGSLTETGFLTDELIIAHNGPQQKYLGLCKLPESKHRRIDIIVTPHNEFYTALVYFTGSGHFNRSMRHMASKMNMSLNEHGLYTGVTRNNGVKVCSGSSLPITSEESIFKYLGVPFRPPEERDY